MVILKLMISCIKLGLFFMQHFASTYLEFQLPLSLVSFDKSFDSGSVRHNLYHHP